MEKISVGFLGLGYYVPPKVLTNKDLEKMVDTTDEWIITRTGIKERRIAGENVATSDLAKEAALKTHQSLELYNRAMRKAPYDIKDSYYCLTDINDKRDSIGKEKAIKEIVEERVSMSENKDASLRINTENEF